MMLWAAALVTALLIPLFLFNFLLFNQGYYHKEFRALGVYEKEPEADSLTNEILQFLKHDQAMSNPKLTDPEKSHLEDVRKILNAMNMLMFALGVVLIVLFYFTV